MADQVLATLQATAQTARCHNSFFRQKQLKSLHESLRQETNAIKDAIKSDNRVSEQEAVTQVALALDLVKEHYASIDPAKELVEEYRITNEKNANDQRKPWGVVYIEPLQNHTPFFSAIAALSAALAAGNCVALKLENNLRTLTPLLRKLLQVLESDTFAVVSSMPSQEALATCLQVLQETQVRQPTYTQLASSHSKSIAIVDRTADLAAAAECLVTARFAFGGSSPYAPDLVFVNEFVKKEFLEYVLKFAIPYLASSEEAAKGSTELSKLGAEKKDSKILEALKFFENSKSWRANIVTQGSNGAIVDLSDVSSLPIKVNHPIFVVSSITSLEHAIGLIDDDLESSTGLLAGYYFGTPSTGKYLAQFIKASISLVNHIHYRLLLGPAAPAFHNIDIDMRYTKAHFTCASPALIAPATPHVALAKMLSGTESKKAAAKALSEALQEIEEKKRAEWIAIGYFEQGILIGLGLYGIPLLACVGTGLFFGVRAGLRTFSLV